MPTRVAVDDDEQQIQDLIKEMGRLRSRLATTSVKGAHDEFTVAATPETTYQLTYIPITGTCAMFNDKHEQEEGTAYTVDYDTGIVTFVTALTTGERINFRYLVTDWLIARSLPPDTGCLVDTFDRANAATPNPASDGGSWTVYAGTWGINSNHLNNQLFSNWSAGGSGGGFTGPDPMGSDQFLARDFGHAAMSVTVTVHHSGADSATGWVALNFDPTTRGAYLLEVGPLTHRVWRAPSNVGGSRTLVGTPTMTVTSPGTTTVQFSHDGAGNISVVQDGTAVGSFTDATPLTGTWAGLGITSNMDTANWFDDFEVCPVP